MSTTTIRDGTPIDDLSGALTVAEFARHFYVAPNTVRRWIDNNEIDSYRVSARKTVIPLRELARRRAELGLAS